MTIRAASSKEFSKEKGHRVHHYSGRKAVRLIQPDLPSEPPREEDFEDLVKRRAYQIYEERVRNHAAGDPLSDWVKAEEEIRNPH